MHDTYPPERVRRAGRTGGEITGEDVTADDAAPETLLDSGPSHSPAAQQHRVPEDTRLRARSAGHIGAAPAQARDEAELAQSDPVGVAASQAQRRTARRHARDPQAVEPHERAAMRDKPREH